MGRGPGTSSVSKRENRKRRVSLFPKSMHEGEAQAQPLLISQLNGFKGPVGDRNAGLLLKAVCACDRVAVQMPLQSPK